MRALLTAAMIMLAGMAAADPIEGRWRTAAQDDGTSGVIEVAPCGPAFCGTLVEAFDASGASVPSDRIGTQIITETTPDGDGRYRGKIYAPDRDTTYNSRLVLSGDRLQVSGCFLGICRDGGTWSRVN